MGGAGVDQAVACASGEGDLVFIGYLVIHDNSEFITARL